MRLAAAALCSRLAQALRLIAGPAMLCSHAPATTLPARPSLPEQACVFVLEAQAIVAAPCVFEVEPVLAIMQHRVVEQSALHGHPP